MNQTKMTVKIYEPLLKSFEDQMDQLCIKRDAFLNHMIKIETPYLAGELDGRRLSVKARRYISGRLKKMGTKTVNLVVDRETADALNAVVETSNIVRDAFINRLVMFLRSSDSLLRFYDLPNFVVRSEFESWYEDMPTSPLKAMESVFNDPLYYLRIAAEERLDSGLYMLGLPERFSGLLIHLDDHSVPGTKEYEELDLLLELDRTETEAFTKKSTNLTNGKGA
jgi:hypothetical protein